MDAIRSISAGLPGAASEVAAPKRDGSVFARQVKEALGDTNELLLEANRSAEGVATGEVDAVEAVLALSKAELALRHTVSLGTRALEAYREVMRLQL